SYKEQETMMIKLTEYRTGYTPKATQLRFAMALVVAKDVTCIAATGFGKSLAFQMAMFMIPRKTGFIITPIEALGQDQVEVCWRYRLKPLAL
ncbi:hypothetical protein L211DRAFT_756949, partial [Terfezia boudieri ATCC MYA-4762]